MDPARYVQIGLRGYWPGETEFAWQTERGIASFFMHDVRRLGVPEVVSGTSRALVTGRSSCGSTSTSSIPPRTRNRDAGTRRDDVCRPARGGACVARRLALVGADVVEVIPTAVGSADMTALVAERVVREVLTGVALRRRG